MEVLIVLASLFLICYVSRGLGKFFTRLSRDIQERTDQEYFFREELLASVKESRGSSASYTTSEPNPVEALLLANKELIEKRQVRDAIEVELGVKL
jgi:hypothetical protein